MKAKTSKKPPRQPPLPAPPPDDLDDDDDDDPPATDEVGHDELAALLSELGNAGDATIVVTKVTVQGEERLGAFMPRELLNNIDSLRDRWGGGAYWLYCRVAGKLKNKERIVFAQTLEERNPAAARATTPAPKEDNTLAVVLAKMQEQQQDMMKFVLQAVTGQRSQGSDMMQVFEMASKMAGMGNRGGGEKSMDAFLSGVKFAREMNEERGGDSGIASVAKEMMETLRMMAAPQLPAPGAQPEGAEQMMIMIQQALRSYLPTLIKGAQGGTDPSVYAQLVLDQVPERFVPSLAQQLGSPNWFDVLVRLDGRCVAHREWFEALAREIVQATSQDPPPTT